MRLTAAIDNCRRASVSNVKALPSPAEVLPESAPSGRALGRPSLSHYHMRTGSPRTRVHSAAEGLGSPRSRCWQRTLLRFETTAAACAEAMRCPCDKAVRNRARRQLYNLLKYSCLKRDIVGLCVALLWRTLSLGTARALAQTITPCALGIIRRVAPALEFVADRSASLLEQIYVLFADRVHLI